MLSLVPQICVLAAEESRCRDSIKLVWEAPAAQDLCLYVNDRDDPLTCWHAQTRGEHHYQADTEESLHFHLRPESGAAPKASALFAVVRETSQYRQRRRNPWSFF